MAKTIRRKNNAGYLKQRMLTFYSWYDENGEGACWLRHYRIGSDHPKYAKLVAKFHSDGYGTMRSLVPAQFRRSLERAKRAADRNELGHYLSGNAEDVLLPGRKRDASWNWW